MSLLFKDIFDSPCPQTDVHVSLVDSGCGMFLMCDTWSRGKSQCGYKQFHFYHMAENLAEIFLANSLKAAVQKYWNQNASKKRITSSMLAVTAV